MIIKKRCPVCKKVAEVIRESKIDNLKIIYYECGHTRAKRIPTPKDFNVISTDGLHPYSYQLEGAAFVARANGRALIADEQGVGKTLQGELVCNADKEEYLPVLIVCKPSLKTQMIRESYRWCGWICQVIDNENEYILPGMQCYIVGYDTLAYQEYTTKKGKLVTRGINNIQEWAEKLKIKTIILDECQQVKNGDAKRTKAVQELARVVPHVIALSGTPISNHAGEYFPILNMLYPEKFPSKAHYVMRWCDTYMSGNTMKIGGIKDIEGFKKFTEDFIIRRTRAEVLPELPAISRRFRFEELGESVKKAYEQAYEDFQNYINAGNAGQSTFTQETCILAYLNKMRHLTGIAKIPGVVEFVKEFIEDTDRKIVVFTHHIDVAKEVVAQLSELRPIYIPSPVDPDKVSKFWENREDARIAVVNTMSMGVGHNLQCCSDFIVMEREWSPVPEEQAEGRFPRPGQKESKITGTYFVAVGTVDEDLAELVERKRSNFAATMDGKEVKWSESNIIKELTEILMAKGAKKWKRG